MNAGNWATIIVALIALISAIFSGRAASGAAKYSSKAQAETEAYGRARKMDIETIERQNGQLEELRKRVKELELENNRLRRRVSQLELRTGETSEQSTTDR